jgi:hypothetical protein
MGGTDTELVLVALAAMLSPTTLTFSVLVLVLSPRPLRTGAFFYLGALGATLAIGVAAAFVLGDLAASSSTGGQKTWVSIFDVVAGAALLVYVARTWRKPMSEKSTQGMVAKMGALADSRWIAVVGAGAALANPGGFIPIALKTISQTNPSTAGYAVQWTLFALVSLLPLGIALILLLASRQRAERLLQSVRVWLEQHVRLIASVIIFLLAVVLLRNGITGLTG